MSSFSINDYKINTLLKQYNHFSSIYYNLEKHINKIYEWSIITSVERVQYLQTISTLIKITNKYHNEASREAMQLTKNVKLKEPSLKDLFPKSNLVGFKDEELYDEIRYLASIYNMMDNITSKKNNDIISELSKDPYEGVKDKLIDLAKQIGLSNMNDIMKVFIGEFYEKLYQKDDLNHIDLYNKLFIPLKITTEENLDIEQEVYLQKVNPKHEFLFDNCADLYIRFPHDKTKFIKINGFFGYDNLNILVKTSMKCYDFLFKKKEEIKARVNERTDIQERFRNIYMKCIGVCDIMGQTLEEFEYKMEKDYRRHRELVKYSFMNMMKDSVKDSKKEGWFRDFQETIKLLLMGDDDKASNAKLLYSITRDKKEGPDTAANAIYRSLPYVLQVKLKKPGSNIKAELEKIKSMTLEDIDFKKQIALSNNMPMDVKKSSYEKVEEMKSSNNEYYKQLLYVKTLLNFPWPSSNEDMFFEDVGKDVIKSQEYLQDVMKKLDEKVYGHEECKSSIERMIGKWLSNPASAGSAIGLKGPPGVGKTLIAKGLGEALGIPFVQIALGGQNDGEILHGHGYTYSSAQPGMVVKKMVEAGSARCVMYFDELDKASKKHDTNEIHDILIHMTDPNMNGEFQDRFFQEIKFPLNKVIFVFSYNDPNKISDILLDRMEKINVEPYSLSDKVHIAKGFLLKELSKNMGYDFGSVKFNDKTLEFLAEEYTLEAGVRELKRKMDTILMKLNIDRIYQRGIFKNVKTILKSKPINITKNMVIDYLEKPKMEIEEIHKKPMVGVVNGLYATTLGKGGIIPIQVQDNKTNDHEKFALKLTGSQGDVMKESILVAFTTAINYVSEDARKAFFKKNTSGFHVHTPSAATPKDGPSAGAAFATAFVSKILDKPIKHDLGMTGEIDIINRVTKIGGLLYKLTGSKKAGVKLVLVSSNNKEDVDQIKKKNPALIKGSFKLKLVDTLADVLREAIIGFKESDLAPEHRIISQKKTKTKSKSKKSKETSVENNN